MLQFHKHLIFLILLTLSASSTSLAVYAQEEEPNVGILRLERFTCPREVYPDTSFQVSVDVRYGLHGRPNNATIRAAIYSGYVNFSNPLWQSSPEIVSYGGDKIWNTTLRSPATEGDLKLTAWAFYLNQGSWDFFNNTDNGPSFLEVTIKIGKTANLDVDLRAPSIPVSVDNETIMTSTIGQAQMAFKVGSFHVISVPAFVDLQNETRLAFGGWSDGSNQTSRTVLLDGDLKLVGFYSKQYLLRVNSIVPDYAHSAWYDDGANLTLHVETSLAVGGVLGFLGLRYVFRGWSGDLISASPSPTLLMDRPKNVNADFTIDYTAMIIPVILVLGVLGGSILMILSRRRKPETASIEEQTSAADLTDVCDSCGEPVEADWTHCVHCGKELRASKTVQG
jgi:hypothetical protein